MLQAVWLMVEKAGKLIIYIQIKDVLKIKKSSRIGALVGFANWHNNNTVSMSFAEPIAKD
jgi:hypothetical protein